MKLEKYKDKKETRKKVMLIGLTVITIVSVAMTLYKTFANFRTSTSFTIMNGKVIYKKKGKELGKDIPVVQGTGDGLYKVEHSTSGIDSGWNTPEYRYAGANPNNYVYFNCSDLSNQSASTCEKWRIIGLVNVKTSDGKIEQRIKIIRNESIGRFSWAKSSYCDWPQASLMGLLNDTFYNSKNDNTYCYRGTPQVTCNFSSDQNPKGLTLVARNMVETNISWNLGGSPYTGDIKTEKMYEYERGSASVEGRQIEWNVGNTKDPISEEYKVGLFKGVGLMYLSDYGYAVGGSVHDTCLAKDLSGYDQDGCYANNFLYFGDYLKYTLSITNANGMTVWSIIAHPEKYGACGNPAAIFPSLYLSSSVNIIDGDGTTSFPYVLSQS